MRHTDAAFRDGLTQAPDAIAAAHAGTPEDIYREQIKMLAAAWTETWDAVWVAEAAWQREVRSPRFNAWLREFMVMRAGD